MRKILILILGLTAGAVAAQSSYLQSGESGPGLETLVSLDESGDLEKALVFVGYSIVGRLDVGVAADVRPYDEGGSDALDIGISLCTGGHVWRQGNGFPFALRLTGSYGSVSVDSDYLDDRGEIRKGRGFALGMDLYRDTVVTSWLIARLGVVGGYRSYLYTTERLEGPQAAPYPITDRESTLFYGAFAGLLVRSRIGPTVGVACAFGWEPPGNLVIRPSIAVAGAGDRRR